MRQGDVSSAMRGKWKLMYRHLQSLVKPQSYAAPYCQGVDIASSLTCNTETVLTDLNIFNVAHYMKYDYSRKITRY